MGRGTAWKAHDVDVMRGWLAAGKPTTAMATLRPAWPKSSMKKLVARLKAAGDDTGPVYSRKRSFRAVSSDQVDEFRAELPTLPRVSVAVVAKKHGTSSSTAWRVLHSTLKKKPQKPTKTQRVSAATRLRRLAFCRCIRLRRGARLRVCKGPSLPTLNLQRVFFSDEKVYRCEYLQHPQNFRFWCGPRQEAPGLRRPSPHRQIAVQSRHHGGHGRRLERHRFLASSSRHSVNFITRQVLSEFVDVWHEDFHCFL